MGKRYGPELKGYRRLAIFDAVLEKIFKIIQDNKHAGLYTTITPKPAWFKKMEFFYEKDHQIFSGMPVVDGYKWYGSYLVVAEAMLYPAELLILSPWIYPQETRTPLLFYRGDRVKAEAMALQYIVHLLRQNPELFENAATNFPGLLL